MRTSNENDSAWGAVLLAVLVIVMTVVFSHPAADVTTSPDMTKCLLCDGVRLF
jgi:hypothetical protein